MFGSILSKIKMMKAYTSNDISTAIKYAEKCITKNEKDIGALWTIAECYRLQGDVDNAIIYGKKLYLIDSEDFETLRLLSEIYFDKKDYSRTYEYASYAVSAAKTFDDEFGAYIDQLRLNLSSSKFLSAPTRFIQKSISDDRRSVRSWINWAVQYMKWYESKVISSSDSHNAE